MTSLAKRKRSKPTADAAEHRRLLKEIFPKTEKVHTPQITAFLEVEVSTVWQMVDQGRIKPPINFGARVSVWDAEYIRDLAQLNHKQQLKQGKATQKSSPNNSPDHDTTKLIFADTMHRRMAAYLVSGWHTMPSLVGADKCGGNPYQYVRTLRHQGVIITRIKQQGERYGKCKITHAESRARVLAALDEVQT